MKVLSRFVLTVLNSARFIKVMSGYWIVLVLTVLISHYMYVMSGHIDSLSSNCSGFTLHVCNVWTVDSLSSNCSDFTLHICNVWIVDKS